MLFYTKNLKNTRIQQNLKAYVPFSLGQKEETGKNEL